MDIKLRDEEIKALRDELDENGRRNKNKIDDINEASRNVLRDIETKDGTISEM